jgi:hypothetical protein
LAKSFRVSDTSTLQGVVQNKLTHRGSANKGIMLASRNEKTMSGSVYHPSQSEANTSEYGTQQLSHDSSDIV